MSSLINFVLAMKKKTLIPILLFGILLLAQIDLEAQCAMCKAVLESNMQSGENAEE